MNILVDIGNSRLKWVQDCHSQFIDKTAIFHLRNDWAMILSCAWQILPAPDKLIISCVAQPAILQTVTQLASQLWSNVEIIIAKTQAQGFGVTNGYQYPEKLGVDRWLTLIAARQFYPDTNLWIMDCGTAITVDFINSEGQHDGGLIAPGLTLMKNSLLQNTAALNFSQQTYNIGLANLTEAAIFNGTLFAAVGLLEHALKIQSEPAVLLLTGGDAGQISSQLLCPFILEPDLIFKGLALIA